MKYNKSNKLAALPALCACVLSLGAANAAITAISGTGWSQDIIIETTATQPDNNNAARTADRQAKTSTLFATYDFYEEGWSTGSQGLSSTGAYTGVGTSYQMQAYNQNNAFINSGTFTLTAATTFTDLAFLVTTQSSVSWTATLNFTDFSSSVLAFSGVDWTSGSSTGVVESNHGLVTSGGGFYSGGLYMVERIATLSVGDQAKTLESITFAKTSGNLAIHAISGTAAIPEPSAALLGGLGFLCLLRRRR